MLEIYDLSEHLFNLFFETILLASQKVLITAPRSMENFDEIAGNGYPLHEWQLAEVRNAPCEKTTHCSAKSLVATVTCVKRSFFSPARRSI